MMKSRKNYKYIYDVKFANYLMLQGVICKGTGIHPKSGNPFWCFDYNDCQPFYRNQSTGVTQTHSIGPREP